MGWSSPARRSKRWSSKRWNTGRNSARSWIGAVPMSTAHCISVGVRRRDCIIITAYGKCCWIKKCSASSATRSCIRGRSCSAVLTMNFGSRIPAIPGSRRKMCAAARSSRYSRKVRKPAFTPFRRTAADRSLSPGIPNTIRTLCATNICAIKTRDLPSSCRNTIFHRTMIRKSRPAPGVPARTCCSPTG